MQFKIKTFRSFFKAWRIKSMIFVILRIVKKFQPVANPAHVSSSHRQFCAAPSQLPSIFPCKSCPRSGAASSWQIRPWFSTPHCIWNEKIIIQKLAAMSDVALLNSGLYLRQEGWFIWFKAFFEAFIHHRLVALPFLFAFLLHGLLRFLGRWRWWSAEFAFCAFIMN